MQGSIYLKITCRNLPLYPSRACKNKRSSFPCFAFDRSSNSSVQKSIYVRSFLKLFLSHHLRFNDFICISLIKRTSRSQISGTLKNQNERISQLFVSLWVYCVFTGNGGRHAYVADTSQHIAIDLAISSGHFRPIPSLATTSIIQIDFTHFFDICFD